MTDKTAPKKNELSWNPTYGMLMSAPASRRAIRYHPNRLRVEVDQIPCHSASEVSLRHDTGDEEEESLDRDEDPWSVHAVQSESFCMRKLTFYRMDIDRSLARYLSNRAKWNESCRMWFEEGGDGEEGAVSEESGLESEEDDFESEEDDVELEEDHLEDE